ncbi:hypothetical protein Bb109J_c1973 [Bdellovibrio bacteriovorus]|nr:hypothetical protein Bb109J_c1973 [Bdellovibrio bacteriovorus]
MKKNGREVNWRGHGAHVRFSYDSTGFRVNLVIEGRHILVTQETYRAGKSTYHRMIDLIKAIHELELVGLAVTFKMDFVK